MSPQILVTSQIPETSPLPALAGRTVTARVETISQMVRRIAEARQAGAEPAVRIVYTDSRWSRVVTPAALAIALPSVATLAGHHATSKAAAIVAILLAALVGEVA